MNDNRMRSLNNKITPRTKQDGEMGAQPNFGASIVAVIVSVLLYLSHEHYVAPRYGYLGFEFVEPDFNIIAQTVFFIIITSLCLSRKADRLSDVFNNVLYFTCFLPALTIAGTMGILDTDQTLFIQISLTAGTLLCIIVPRLGRVWKFKAVNINLKTYTYIILILFLVLNFLIIAFNYQNMNLVDFDNVNTQRFFAREYLGLNAYTLGIASGSVNPALIALGLVRKRSWLVVLGVFGQIACYAVLAQRFVLVGTVSLIVLYFFLKSYDFKSSSVGLGSSAIRKETVNLLPIGVLTIMLLGFSLMAGLAANFGDTVFSSAGVLSFIDLILLRKFVLPGGMITQWWVFFETHPHTFFTHLRPVQFFFAPVYELDPSISVGRFLAGNALGMNANASFFASDGIAAIGPLGPPLMGLIVGSTFYVLDKLASKDFLAPLSALSLFLVFTLGESSYFTSLVTGGGILTAILIYLFRSAAERGR